MRHGSLTAAPPRPPRPHSLVHDAESKDADLPSLSHRKHVAKDGWCQKYARAENVALTHFRTVLRLYIYIYTYFSPSRFLAASESCLRFPRRGALNSFIGDQKRQTVTIRRRETVDEHASKIPLFFSPYSFQTFGGWKIIRLRGTHTPEIYRSADRIIQGAGYPRWTRARCTTGRAGNQGIGDLLRMAMGNNCAFALVAGGGFHGRLHDSR